VGVFVLRLGKNTKKLLTSEWRNKCVCVCVVDARPKEGLSRPLHYIHIQRFAGDDCVLMC
jgi:hypothetical protein